MITWNGICLPDGERHLQGWMNEVNRWVEGLPTYQYHKLEAAMKHLPPRRRRVAIDVGAHVGLWSMHLVRLFDFTHAFEPMKEHRECFERNVPLAGRVLLYPHALGAKSGWVGLGRRTPDSSGDTGVLNVPPAKAKEAGAEIAPLRTLDSYGIRRVDLLKVDCEGFEREVLHGAEETLRQSKPVVVVEQKPGMGQRYGFGETDAVKFLEGLGARRLQEISGDFIMGWPA